MSNAEWHRLNPQPIYPRAHFLGWYLRHEAACDCQPIPETVLRELDALGIVTPGRTHRFGIGQPAVIGQHHPVPRRPSPLPVLHSS